MKLKSEFDKERFDDAMIAAFNNAPSCGDFGEIDTLRRRRAMNRILAAAPAHSAFEFNDIHSPPRARAVRWIWAAAAVLVAAIAVIFFLKMTSSPKSDALKISSGQTWFGEVVRAGESVIVDDHSVSNHARVPVDRSIFTNNDNALLRLPTGIDWWLSAQSEGQVAAVTETQIEVAVNTGESWFRVDPERKDAPAFAVQTPLGKIHITGTIFVVNATAAEVTVTLLKGEVWIARHTGQRTLLKQGHAMRLRNGRLTALSMSDMQHHNRQLMELAWLDDETALPDNTVDDALLSGEETHRTADGPKKYTSSVPVTRVKPINVQQIHREIQFARTRGDWQRVASLYQKIIQAAPGSEADIVSRVSLGDVYLTKLHRYNDALRHFNRYIHSKHRALYQEALFGKCATLKALKDGISETKCLEQFVEKFPTAFQTPDAKARLRVLQKRTDS